MKTTFNVSMSCGHCKKRIEDKVTPTNGINKLEVNLADKTVDIDYNEAIVAEKELQAAIEALGFQVSK